MRHRHIRPLAMILGLALALRLAAAFGLQWYLDEHAGREFLIPGDANGYWALAQQIAAGEEYNVNDPPRRILRMPGFPAVLALANGNLLAARIILAILGTVACWLVYCLGRQLFDERVGLIAAALCAISPAMVAFSVVILSETTFAAAMLLSLWGMARFWNRYAEIRGQRSDVGHREGVVADRTAEFAGRDSVLGTQSSVLGTEPTENHTNHQSPITTHDSPLTQTPESAILPLCVGAVVIGITVALASFVRPSWLLFGPAFALAFAAKTRILKESLAVAVCVIAGIGVTLSPWIVRNYRVTGGRFVATTLWVGPSLYDGLNPTATGESDMTFFRRDNLLGQMSEYEMDREYRNRAWQFARDNPGRAIALAGPKLARYWSPWPNAPQFRRWWLTAATVVFFLLIVLPALYAAWALRDRRDVLLLALCPILYFAAIHSVFVGSIRYRLPAEYPLCIITAAGLAALFDRRSFGRKQTPRSCVESASK